MQRGLACSERRLAGRSIAGKIIGLSLQIHKSWLSKPAILHAHDRNTTGEPIPEAMLAALFAARTFNHGFVTKQQILRAILDMRLQQMTSQPADFDEAARENAHQGAWATRGYQDGAPTLAAQPRL